MSRGKEEYELSFKAWDVNNTWNCDSDLYDTKEACCVGDILERNYMMLPEEVYCSSTRDVRGFRLATRPSIRRRVTKFVRKWKKKLSQERKEKTNRIKSGFKKVFKKISAR